MPRLARGQTAPGIAARSARQRDMALKKLDMLQNLLRQDPIDRQLARSFRTLASIASLERPNDGLMSISENTLRKHIKTDYPGGAAAFSAHLASLGPIFHRASTDVVRELVKSLQTENQQLLRAITDWSARYHDLLKRMRNLSDSYKAVKNNLVEHQRRFAPTKANLRLVK